MNQSRALSGPETEVSSAHEFAATVVRWQRAHGRHDLPWQLDRSAYRVWLSEIMLQQTQVATARPYFERFVARFPDLASLAAAPLESVIGLWAGLGYYARARNLHACARAVIALGGEFPQDVASLAALPGVGRSTAGAIAALAFGQRAAILDGNVKRLLSRYYAITAPVDEAATLRRLWACAEQLAPTDDIGSYTQGLMDLGASLCTRQRPACHECPLRQSCAAFRKGLVSVIPARRPRKAAPRRECCFLLIDDGEAMLFERRPPSGIWGGLLSLPEAAPGQVDVALAALGLEATSAPQSLPAITHAFTHFSLLISPWLISVRPCGGVGESGRIWLRADEAVDLGVPAPVLRLLNSVAGR